MNSASLQPSMSAAPRNSRPQSSTTPSDVKPARKAAVSPALAASTSVRTGRGSSSVIVVRPPGRRVAAWLVRARMYAEATPARESRRRSDQFGRGTVLLFGLIFGMLEHRMHDYGFFSYDSKADFIERSKRSWNPDKTQFWQDAGVDLVIDRREGYLFWDMEGRRLIDLHLNGGTYNLGHRNRELITTLEQAMEHFDIGNHHFPALARTALAEELVKTSTPNMRRVIYGSGGGEAIDIAIKTARHTTAAPQDRLDRQGLPRPHRARGRCRRPALLRALPLRSARRVRAGAVQRPGRDGGRAARTRRRRRADGDDPRDLRVPPARARLPAGRQAPVRALRRALHRRRGADRPDADGRDVGHPEDRHRARHHGRRQGHHGRHVPDRVRGRQRGVLGLARGGRLRPHLDRRRRRARLHRRAQGARDLRPARGALDGALHLGSLRTRAARDPGPVPRLVHGHPPGRRGDGPRVRPPAGRQARHARALPARRLGDLLDARPARPAVQARASCMHPRAGRRGARPHRGRDRTRVRRGSRRVASARRAALR